MTWASAFSTATWCRAAARWCAASILMRAHKVDAARVDDDELRAQRTVVASATSSKLANQVRVRRIGADDDDDVGLRMGQ